MSFFHHAKQGLLSLLISTSISCSNSSSLTMIISNIPANTAEINISAKVEEKDYTVESITKSQIISNALIVKINIPFDTRGVPLTLNATSKDSKCELAGWSGIFGSVENGDYTINAPLEKFADDPISQDLYSVQALSENDIWAAGTTLAHWDGCYWKQKSLNNETTEATEKISTLTSITKLYAANDKTLFAIGNNSQIYYYINNKWSQVKIENYWGLTGNIHKDITWFDINTLADTPDQVLIIGVIPGLTKKAIKLIKVNDKYEPFEATSQKLAELEGTIFNQPIQLSDCIHQFKCPASYTCTYNLDKTSLSVSKILSLPSAFFTAGSVIIERTKTATSGTQVERLKYGFYSKFQDITKTTPAPTIRIFNSIKDDGLPIGDEATIWGLNANDIWVGSTRLYHITATPPTNSPTELIPTPINNRTDSSYKFSTIWGNSTTELWTISLNQAKTTQTLHLTTKSTWSDLLGDQFYRVPLDNFVTTSIHGISPSDIWIVGYNGYRIHYKDGNFALSK